MQVNERFVSWLVPRFLSDDSALLISIDGGGGPDPAFIYVSRNFSPEPTQAAPPAGPLAFSELQCAVSSLPCYLSYPHPPAMVPAEEPLHTPILEPGVAVLSDSDATQGTKSLPHADRSLQGTVTGWWLLCCWWGWWGWWWCCWRREGETKGDTKWGVEWGGGGGVEQ